MAFWARVFRTARRPTPILLIALALGLAVALTGCTGTSEQYPQSSLHPKSDMARMLDGVFMTTVWWALAVFILVEGALVYVILKYRGNPGDAEPKQIHGNTALELVWTAVPALILAMIAVPTVRAIFRTYEVPNGNALVVEVYGHQWWWEFRYPEYGVTTANELHVPIGRTVLLRMQTVDVLHAFSLPQLAGKRDVFQNRVNTLWFRADSVGYYSGQCAEFCGIQHGQMRFHVAAATPAEFDAHIAGLRATGAGTTVSTLGASAQQPAPAAAAPADSAGAPGAKLFAGRGCVACHLLDATSKAKMVGPNLANVGSRRYIGAGVALNTDENLARWIQNPHQFKQGVVMPAMGLTLDESRAVAAYLRTRK